MSTSIPAYTAPKISEYNLDPGGNYVSPALDAESSVTDGTTIHYYSTVGAHNVDDASGNALFVQAAGTITNGYINACNYAVFSNLTGDTQTVTVNVDSGGSSQPYRLWGRCLTVQPSIPVIQSIGVAGSTFTLSWTAGDKGVYSIWRKTDLTFGNWSMVATNLLSRNQTTLVTARGTHQEFFQVRYE